MKESGRAPMCHSVWRGWVIKAGFKSCAYAVPKSIDGIESIHKLCILTEKIKKVEEANILFLKGRSNGHKSKENEKLLSIRYLQ